jgi:hypoxanthine phosphoribosyltransferase
MKYFETRTTIIWIFKTLLQIKINILRLKLVYDLQLVKNIYYGYKYEIEWVWFVTNH